MLEPPLVVDILVDTFAVRPSICDVPWEDHWSHIGVDPLLN